MRDVCEANSGSTYVGKEMNTLSTVYIMPIH